MDVFPDDPRLPELALATDGSQMQPLLAAHVRARRPASIVGCELAGFRYRAGRRCVVHYCLRVRDDTSGEEGEVPATGVVYGREAYPARRASALARELASAAGSAVGPTLLPFEPVGFVPEVRMLVQLFPFDRRLPTLPLVLARPPGKRAGRGTTELVRYRPQLGAVFRYAAGDAGRVYAKVYPDVTSGERAWALLQSAWKRVPATGEAFAVTRPRAWHGRLRTLVLEETPGTPVDQMLVERRVPAEVVRACARALVELNRGEPVVGARRVTVADELAGIQRAAALVRWASSEVRPAVDALVARLARALDDVEPAPVHGDLKLDHIVVAERPALVDLDSFSLADPALDPATLVARLHALPYERPVSRSDVEAAADLFVQEYFAQVPDSWARRVPAHYAGATLEIAASLFRRQRPGWRAALPALVERALAAVA